MNCSLINLSGVFRHENFPFLSFFDLEGLEGTNCYCSPEAAEAIKRTLADIPPRSACWIDTGDYHYISYFRGLQLAEPFELVLFDNHTDDFDETDCLSCGNWVTALKNEANCKAVSFNILPQTDYPVFLSIDLDVLRPEDFRTNWDQGTMRFEDLLETIRNISRTRCILAIDICGGLTESKGATKEDLELNLTRRLQLQSLLNSL